VLHLIKMWLESPVEETDDRGRKTRTTAARDNRRGIPQGSPSWEPILPAPKLVRLLRLTGLSARAGDSCLPTADDGGGPR